MRPPVVRVRADLSEYVNEQADRRSVTASEFVNGVIETHRLLDARNRLGLEPQFEQLLMGHKGRWVALLLVLPGQPVMLAAGMVEEVRPTTVTLSIPTGIATQRYDVARAWVDAYYFIKDQPRSELRGIVARLSSWTLTLHHYTHSFLGGV